MRNDPSKNSSGSAQAELIVAGNSRQLWKLRALVLGGYGRGCSEICLRGGFTHAMMLAIAPTASGQGRLPRSEERHCHGQAHHNGQ